MIPAAPQLDYAPTPHSLWKRIWRYGRWLVFLLLVALAIQLIRIAWPHVIIIYDLSCIRSSVPTDGRPIYDDDPVTAPVLLKDPNYNSIHISSPAKVYATRKNPAWDRCTAAFPRLDGPSCLLLTADVAGKDGRNWLLTVIMNNRHLDAFGVMIWRFSKPLALARYVPEWGDGNDLYGDFGDNVFPPPPQVPMRIYAATLSGHQITIPYELGGIKRTASVDFDDNWEIVRFVK